MNWVKNTHPVTGVWVLSAHPACPSGVAALFLGWFFSVLWLPLTCNTPCFLSAEGRDPSSRAEPCPLGRPFNWGTPLLKQAYFTHFRRYLLSPQQSPDTIARSDAAARPNHRNYTRFRAQIDNPVTGCGDLWSVLYIYASVNCRHKHFECRLYTSVEPCEAIA